MSAAIAASADKPALDRAKTCPMCVRVYAHTHAHARGDPHAHHAAAEYAPGRTPPPETEIVIHTWPDATLRELVDIIKMSDVPACARLRTHAHGHGAREDRGSAPSLSTAVFYVALVYPDRTGRFVTKDIGTVAGVSVREGAEDGRTLAEVGLEAGDFLDVCVH